MYACHSSPARGRAAARPSEIERRKRGPREGDAVTGRQVSGACSCKSPDSVLLHCRERALVAPGEEAVWRTKEIGLLFRDDQALCIWHESTRLRGVVDYRSCPTFDSDIRPEVGCFD